MVLTSELINFEIGLVSMLTTLILTLSVCGLILYFMNHLKRNRKIFILSSLKKRKLEMAAMMKVKQKPIHMEDNIFTFDESFQSVMKYSMSYTPIIGKSKLSICVMWVKIGGRNNSIKSLVESFKNIYLRLLLNNNVSNSIIASEEHRFNTTINFQETFIFLVERNSLPETSVTIEVYANFKDDDQEFLIGWAELPIPSDKFPLEEEQNLEMPQRPIDQYLRAMGFLCISLASSHNRIKLGICATTYLDLGNDTLSHENTLVFFSIKTGSESNESVTHTREYRRTIVWNNIFLFEIDNENKRESIINIYLWRISKRMTITSEPSKKIGFLTLGMTDSCSRKAQEHWKYVLDHRNEDHSKWYNINIYDKES